MLGEPGAGKSTALEHEAVAEGGDIATCREVMNGTPLGVSGTAYLDALDEYRSGDSGKDKLLRLANAISKSNTRRWRLTRRAEDWRATADINAMRRAANNEPALEKRPHFRCGGRSPSSPEATRRPQANAEDYMRGLPPTCNRRETLEGQGGSFNMMQQRCWHKGTSGCSRSLM